MQNSIRLHLKRRQRILLLALFINCLVVLSFVSGSLVMAQDQRDTHPPTNNLSAVVDGNTAFAFDLYHQLALEQDGNLIFSPYSISLNMAMLYAGAKGDTAAQIAKVLHFTLPPDQFHPTFNALDLALKRTGDEPLVPTPTLEYVNPAEDLTLTIANSLWTQTGLPLEQPFVDTLHKNYGAEVNQIDFSANPDAAQQTISHWVEEQTRGRIKDMPTPGSITSDTQLALINAIYFKGEWTYPFDTQKTHDAVFHLIDNTNVSVPMMVADSAQASCLKEDNYQAIKLSYGQSGNASMLILSPEIEIFQQFESQLNTDFLKNIQANLSNVGDLALQMPKFHFETNIDLKTSLSMMGLSIPFESDADFSGINSQSKLAIGYGEHKATIAVDEEGTEAVGATATIMLLLSVRSDCEPVIVDRPFIFVIYDHETNAILFMGRVMNPAT